MGSTAVVLSTTQQTAIDKRQTVGEGAVGVSSDSSTVTVNQLDQGAIKSAFDYASGADARMGASYAALLKAAGGVAAAGSAQAGKVADALGKLGSSQSGASDLQRMMIIGLLGVAGLVVASLWKRA